MINISYTKEEYSYSSLMFLDKIITERFDAYWELELSGVSGDYLHLSSHEILDIYLQSIKDKYPDGVIEIVWFIRGNKSSLFSFMPNTNDYRSLLDVYTHPVCVSTGSPISWDEIPVCDLARTDNSGFIQELTGWKPKPMQLTVTIEELKALVKASAA